MDNNVRMLDNNVRFHTNPEKEIRQLNVHHFRKLEVLFKLLRKYQRSL